MNATICSTSPAGPSPLRRTARSRMSGPVCSACWTSSPRPLPRSSPTCTKPWCRIRWPSHSSAAPRRCAVPGASLVHRWFTDPGARNLHPPEDHAHHSRVFVADLQAVAARRGSDTEVSRMVAELRGRSREFAALGETHDVALRRADHKRIVHPALGVIELDCHSVFSEEGRRRLLWFSAPPGTEGAAQLSLLSVIGTQDMALSTPV